MSTHSFLRRYLLSLLGAWPRAELFPAGDGGDGYGFWHRYWASLLSVTLPRGPRADQEDLLPSADAVRPAIQPLSAIQSDAQIFSLPLPPARAALAAASRDDTVVLRSASPDGRVEFILHRMDTTESDYQLEVVLRTSETLPLVVLVQYGNNIEDRRRQIIIPITRAPLGPPSSLVRLPGFDPGLPWQASSATSPSQVQEWHPTSVAFSVKAAATASTNQAWREVARLVATDIRHVIEVEGAND